ncbi:MAG: DUF1592 domain-containing protein [Thalassotalea sp.]
MLIPFNGVSGDGITRFFGRFHVLVLHFPITLIVLIPILELVQRKKHLQNVTDIILLIWWFASISAFITVLLGMTLAANEGFDFEKIQYHLIAGIVVAILTFTCTGLKYVISKRVNSNTKFASTNQKSTSILTTFYTTLSVVLLCALIIAAHAGGNLVHGDTYLTRYAPQAIKSWLPEEKQAIDLSQVKDQHFVKKVQPLIQQYCFSCHGDDKQKGGIQLSVLNPDFINGHDAPQWHGALDMINSGEMPPAKEQQPSDEERQIIVDWLTGGIKLAKESKKGKSKQVIQRLTKQQYTNTLQDLLDVKINFGVELPDDPISEIGFSNNAELLSSSTLHLETFQKIARNALEQAINIGEKPPVHHYRMHFGKGIGKGQPNTTSRGYLDLPVSQDDFFVEILSENNEAKSGESVEKLKKYFSASMRGSDPKRLQIKEQGITLLSALPHKETTEGGQYGAWHGPSPNLAMQIKDQYPSEGAFAIRVKASKGETFNLPLINATSLTNAKSLVNLDKKKVPKKQPKNGRNTLVLASTKFKNVQGLVKSKNLARTLIPDNSSSHIAGEITVDVPYRGSDYFQIDLVHPEVSADAMSSITLSINDEITFNSPIFPTGKAKPGELVTSSIGMAYLIRDKKIKVSIKSDANFSGFSDIVFTKINGDNEHVNSLKLDYYDNSKFANAKAELIPYIGSRTDDGMDYKTFSDSVTVTNSTEHEKIYSFYGRLENLPIPPHGTQGNHITNSSLKVGLWNHNLVKKDTELGSSLHIDYIEFEAPYFEKWPSQTHQNIFIESNQSNKTSEPEVYAKEVLQNFITKAYRRPVTEDELALYMNYWLGIKGDYPVFEESIKETLVAVLSSTNFLYLAEPEQDEILANTSLKDADTTQSSESLISSVIGISTANASTQSIAEKGKPNSEYALASRLSYFLWNSPPDAELLSLAKTGQLSAQLPQQIERLLADDKVMRFIKVFTREWLRLDRQQGQTVDVATFPDYTRFVKQDMALETQHFFKTLLQENLSVLNVIDADFTMLNQNLAEFYGIDTVYGSQFTKVALNDEDKTRGGLLSQGAFLTGHADGIHSHPVKRAVWLKEKILGDKPPPPPPNVPELDPETPGFEKLTLKQQLELHRDKDSCRDCHAKIDPYGVVFEKYDAVGRLRQAYKGRDIDDHVILPNGTPISGVSEIKGYLMKDQKDQVALSVIKHLYAYALGKEVSFHDEDALEEILEKTKKDHYQMQTLINAIVESSAFDSVQQINANKNESEG